MISEHQHSDPDGSGDGPVDGGSREVWDLLSRLSHEMRTPLGAILGFAQLMESGRPAPSEAQRRSLGLIVQAGWYLEKLISMTRELAQLESGSLSLDLESVPLSQVLMDCRTAIEAQARKRGVSVSFTSIDTPCFVWADRCRLRQVLVNCLSGAIEDSDLNGTIVVSCEARRSGWIDFRINAPQPDDGPLQNMTGRESTEISVRLVRSLIQSMEGCPGVETRIGARKGFSFALKQVFPPMATDRQQGSVYSSDHHADAITG